MLHEQQPVGEPGERIGHRFRGDVRMDAVYLHRVLRGIPLDHTPAHGPMVGPVLVAQSMADFELAGTSCQEGVDGARHLVDVVWMNPVEPSLRSITNLMFLASHEAEPP